jgi:nitrogen regulatory protein PII
VTVSNTQLLTVNGITVSEVKGFGRQKGHSDIHQGTEYFMPEVKFEIVIQDALVRKAMQVIGKTAQTGKIEDGKVFVVAFEEPIRIQTGERGSAGLSFGSVWLNHGGPRDSIRNLEPNCRAIGPPQRFGAL